MFMETSLIVSMAGKDKVGAYKQVDNLKGLHHLTCMQEAASLVAVAIVQLAGAKLDNLPHRNPRLSLSRRLTRLQLLLLLLLLDLGVMIMSMPIKLDRRQDHSPDNSSLFAFLPVTVNNDRKYGDRYHPALTVPILEHRKRKYAPNNNGNIDQG